MPKPIQRPEQAIALSRKYALKGKLPLMLDEVVVPVEIIGNLDVEDGTVTPCVVTFQDAAGGAGAFSNVCLENPIGSGILARVSRIDSSDPVTGGVELRREEPLTVALDASQTGFTRDSRDWGRASTCLVGIATTVGPLPVVGPVWSQATDWAVGGGGGRAAIPPMSWVLIPGTRVWISARTANQAVRGSFVWTEEPFQPSEQR